MGAAGSQPLQRGACCVELRLERPAAGSGLEDFAVQLHTAAQGSVRCENWADLHALKLYGDDVITVTLSSKAGDHGPWSAPQAEVCMPLSQLCDELVAREEVVLDLGLELGGRCLGQDATLQDYEQAFERARKLATDVRPNRQKPVPNIRIRISLRPQAPHMPPTEAPVAKQAKPSATPAAASNATSTECARAEELSAEDMRHLFQLQVRNRELRAELGLEESNPGPQVESEAEAFVEQLRQAWIQNQSLKSMIKNLSRELQTMDGNQDEASTLESSLLAHLKEEEAERRSQEVMEAVQRVTRENIELTSSSEIKMRELEGELEEVLVSTQQAQDRAPPWMTEQLEVLRADCDCYEKQLEEAARRRKMHDQRAIQRLKLEHEVQLQEIGYLEEIFGSHKERPAPPSTDGLEQEVLQLHHELAELQRRGTQERVTAEGRAEELRYEMRSLEKRFEHAVQEKLLVENEVEVLKVAHGSKSAALQEFNNLQDKKDFISKERVRTERRISVLEEKIASLNKEADDIRQRASLVLRSVPDVPNGVGHSPQASEWQRAVHDSQQKLQEKRREEAVLTEEQGIVQREHEALQVEASVWEQKLQLLHGRMPSEQKWAAS
eukprot:TRINITY_DN42505_c0_g1_i1.p1 TRINITY_DN42505_c0_g1~~TRINITY_DN42505_c0_g1_i1.p1  ORF type:complete len:620 (+),score=166.10 TRINITY_DN42505_c0_g1_i1:28-1860(+)